MSIWYILLIAFAVGFSIGWLYYLKLIIKDRLDKYSYNKRKKK